MGPRGNISKSLHTLSIKARGVKAAAKCERTSAKSANSMDECASATGKHA